MALETGEFEVNRSFIGVGDEYVEHREKPLHHIKGVKQFLTTSPKHGQTAGTFGGTYEIKPLYSGEPYVEPGKGTTREKMKSRERYINPRGFVPSSPAKKMTGPGSYDGAFTEYEHLDDGVFPKREEPPKMKKDFESRRPILTSPPKRGGPGVPGVLLGPTPEHKADSYGEVEERRKVRRVVALRRTYSVLWLACRWLCGAALSGSERCLRTSRVCKVTRGRDGTEY